MKDDIVQGFLSFTDKYGLNAYLLASIIVLIILLLKLRGLLRQKEQEGKINTYEYPTLILGILVFIILLIISF